MKRLSFVALVLIMVSCGGESKTSEPGVTQLSRTPVSVRGWIADVEGPPQSGFKTVETEAARRLQIFQATTVWIEGAPYVSGGVAENGSMILLDVPPGNITISFNAPGAEAAKLVMLNVPGTADVLLPGLILKKNSVDVANPAAVRIRVAGSVDKARPTGKNAIVAGHNIPVIETPIAELMDRQNWPVPEGPVVKPMARVK